MTQFYIWGTYFKNGTKKIAITSTLSGMCKFLLLTDTDKGLIHSRTYQNVPAKNEHYSLGGLVFPANITAK